jgi:hypothetical protein
MQCVSGSEYLIEIKPSWWAYDIEAGSTCGRHGRTILQTAFNYWPLVSISGTKTKTLDPYNFCRVLFFGQRENIFSVKNPWSSSNVYYFFLLVKEGCPNRPCGAWSHCNKTSGSATCQCEIGFSGNGSDCTGKLYFILNPLWSKLRNIIRAVDTAVSGRGHFHDVCPVYWHICHINRHGLLPYNSWDYVF